MRATWIIAAVVLIIDLFNYLATIGSATSAFQEAALADGCTFGAVITVGLAACIDRGFKRSPEQPKPELAPEPSAT